MLCTSMYILFLDYRRIDYHIISTGIVIILSIIFVSTLEYKNDIRRKSKY